MLEIACRKYIKSFKFLKLLQKHPNKKDSQDISDITKKTSNGYPKISIQFHCDFYHCNVLDHRSVNCTKKFQTVEEHN